MKKIFSLLIFIWIPIFLSKNNKSVFFDSVLNKKTLELEIVKNNIYFPEIVLKQALYETGHLTSNLAINGNNLFGLRNCDPKNTYSIGKQNGYLIFRKWEDSVKEYKLFQEKKFNKEYYKKFLRDIGYAESEKYSEEIEKIKIF